MLLITILNQEQYAPISVDDGHIRNSDDLISAPDRLEGLSRDFLCSEMKGGQTFQLDCDICILLFLARGEGGRVVGRIKSMSLENAATKLQDLPGIISATPTSLELPLSRRL